MYILYIYIYIYSITEIKYFCKFLAFTIFIWNFPKDVGILQHT